TKNEHKNSYKPTTFLAPTPEPSSSLNLISGYCSGSDHSDYEESEQNKHKILSSMIDELIDKVEKTNIIPKKMNNNKTSINRKRTTTVHHRKQLQYSDLNLFQKLMLQDVRSVKSDLLQSLKLLIDTNFLETN
ncbi:hypothetical protein BLA29_013975, partial [Euroglyphus maynei]